MVHCIGWLFLCLLNFCFQLLLLGCRFFFLTLVFYAIITPVFLFMDFYSIMGTCTNIFYKYKYFTIAFALISVI